MDGEEEVLVGGGAKDVADEPELPGEKGGVAEVPGPEDLHGDDAGDDVLCQGLRPAELGDLVMRLLAIKHFTDEIVWHCYRALRFVEREKETCGGLCRVV